MICYPANFQLGMNIAVHGFGTEKSIPATDASMDFSTNCTYVVNIGILVINFSFLAKILRL